MEGRCHVGFAHRRHAAVTHSKHLRSGSVAALQLAWRSAVVVDTRYHRNGSSNGSPAFLKLARACSENCAADILTFNADISHDKISLLSCRLCDFRSF